jgi:hypothetical protein
VTCARIVALKIVGHDPGRQRLPGESAFGGVTHNRDHRLMGAELSLDGVTPDASRGSENHDRNPIDTLDLLWQGPPLAWFPIRSLHLRFLYQNGPERRFHRHW